MSILFISGFLADFASRCALVAVPLVALFYSGSPVLAGASAGAIAVPMALAPWWSSGLRERVRNAVPVGLVTLIQALGVILLPVGIALSWNAIFTVLFSGLVQGFARTLTLPARQALMADVAEHQRRSPAKVLAWQEAMTRLSSVAGPALGALAVLAGYRMELVVGEGVALCLAAALTMATRARGQSSQGTSAAAESPHTSAPVSKAEPAAPRLREVLRLDADIAAGWFIRAVAGFTWFPFALGLALKGADSAQPGLIYAIGVGTYGVGAACGSILAGQGSLLKPSAALAGAGWMVNGAAWVLMGLWHDTLSYALGGLLGGFGAATGFATITLLILQRTSGSNRRALLAAQVTVVETTTGLGMLIGGSVLSALGVDSTLVLSGILLAVMASLGLRSLFRSDQSTPAVKDPAG